MKADCSRDGGWCQYAPVVAEVLVLVAVAVWAVMGVYVSVTDLRDAIIPRRACWAAGIAVAGLLGVAAVVIGDPARLLWAVVGAASVGVFLDVVYRLRPGKIGFGDVRLIIVNSLLAAWWGVPWAWWALCARALAEWPVALTAVIRHGRKAIVRWTPGLVLGTAAVVAFRLFTDAPAG